MREALITADDVLEFMFSCPASKSLYRWVADLDPSMDLTDMLAAPHPELVEWVGRYASEMTKGPERWSPLTPDPAVPSRTKPMESEE